MNTLLSPLGSQRVRRQLKPVVVTKIIPFIPEDAKEIYKEFCENNSNVSLKYINTEGNELCKNPFKMVDSKRCKMHYPKLKPFIPKVKGVQANLDINQSAVLPETRSFRFNKRTPKHSFYK